VKNGTSHSAQPHAAETEYRFEQDGDGAGVESLLASTIAALRRHFGANFLPHLRESWSALGRLSSAECANALELGRPALRTGGRAAIVLGILAFAFIATAAFFGSGVLALSLRSASMSQGIWILAGGTLLGLAITAGLLFLCYRLLRESAGQVRSAAGRYREKP
jgi:hypothetical protein